MKHIRNHPEEAHRHKILCGAREPLPPEDTAEHCFKGMTCQACIALSEQLWPEHAGSESLVQARAQNEPRWRGLA